MTLSAEGQVMEVPTHARVQVVRTLIRPSGTLSRRRNGKKGAFGRPFSLVNEKPYSMTVIRPSVKGVYSPPCLAM